MLHGEYKKVLYEIFDVLGFFEHEKEQALEGFKKKFANQLLMEVRDCLSDEQRDWIAAVAAKKAYDKADPTIPDIQKTIDSAYPGEKMEKVGHTVFKNILTSYIGVMSQKVDSEKAGRLNQILKNF